jgi:hypothetical protein
MTIRRGIWKVNRNNWNSWWKRMSVRRIHWQTHQHCQHLSWPQRSFPLDPDLFNSRVLEVPPPAPLRPKELMALLHHRETTTMMTKYVFVSGIQRMYPLEYNEATSSGQRITTQHVIVHAISTPAKMYTWERPACSPVCEGNWNAHQYPKWSYSRSGNVWWDKTQELLNMQFQAWHQWCTSEMQSFNSAGESEFFSP